MGEFPNDILKKLEGNNLPAAKEELIKLIPTIFDSVSHKNFVNEGRFHKFDLPKHTEHAVTTLIDKIVPQISNLNIINEQVDGISKMSLSAVALIHHDEKKPQQSKSHPDLNHHTRIASHSIGTDLKYLKLSKPQVDFIRELIENHHLLYDKIETLSKLDRIKIEVKIEELESKGIFESLLIMTACDLASTAGIEATYEELDNRMSYINKYLSRKYETEFNLNLLFAEDVNKFARPVRKIVESEKVITPDEIDLIIEHTNTIANEILQNPENNLAAGQELLIQLMNRSNHAPIGVNKPTEESKRRIRWGQAVAKKFIDAADQTKNSIANILKNSRVVVIGSPAVGVTLKAEQKDSVETKPIMNDGKVEGLSIKKEVERKSDLDLDIYVNEKEFKQLETLKTENENSFEKEIKYIAKQAGVTDSTNIAIINEDGVISDINKTFIKLKDGVDISTLSSEDFEVFAGYLNSVLRYVEASYLSQEVAGHFMYKGTQVSNKKIDDDRIKKVANAKFTEVLENPDMLAVAIKTVAAYLAKASAEQLGKTQDTCSIKRLFSNSNDLNKLHYDTELDAIVLPQQATTSLFKTPLYSSHSNENRILIN